MAAIKRAEQIENGVECAFIVGCFKMEAINGVLFVVVQNGSDARAEQIENSVDCPFPCLLFQNGVVQNGNDKTCITN
jgi:hypothetical protein